MYNTVIGSAEGIQMLRLVMLAPAGELVLPLKAYIYPTFTENAIAMDPCIETYMQSSRRNCATGPTQLGLAV